MNSIHSEQNAIDKVTVDEFFVNRGEYDVSTDLVKDEVCSISSSNVEFDNSMKCTSVDFPTLSAHDVVVNVLNELVTSISE